MRQKEGEEKTIKRQWFVGGGGEKEETWKDGRRDKLGTPSWRDIVNGCEGPQLNPWTTGL